MTDLVYVRPVKPSDQKDFWDWAESTHEFDPEIMRYPDTFCLAGFDSSGVVAYLPVQEVTVAQGKPLMLESVVFRPAATELQKTRALRQLFLTCINLGYMKATQEMYFVGTDDRTNQWAQKLGFEKIEYPVYRLRLSDLEK